MAASTPANPPGSVIRVFTAGGTLPLGAESYLQRSADEELFRALREEGVCYVLDSRQKGKSSLVTRVAQDLGAVGVTTVRIDLQRLGANLPPEQWYGGIAYGVASELGLTGDLARFWRDRPELGPQARWLAFLEEVVLPKTPGRIAVIFDEIDFVRSLPFSADEFFAGIRGLVNRRPDRPDLTRLAVCFVGSTTPGELIRNPAITPFNVGRRIDLHDFRRQDLDPYAAHLADDPLVGASVLDRVHHWTDGHPYLTQVVCRELESLAEPANPDDVDAIVKRVFLSPTARRTEPNLLDSERRMLEVVLPDASPESSRAAVLELYRQVLAGKEILAEETNAPVVALKLAGLCIEDEGVLRVRNRIYGTVFDESWRRRNLPDAERRRIQRAARSAALRATLLSMVVVTIVGGLAVANNRLAREAAAERDSAQYEAYVGAMNSASGQAADNFVAGIGALVDSQAHNPARGWEWDYWHRQATDGFFPWDDGANFDFRWARDGRTFLVRNRHGIWRVDPVTGGVIQRIAAPRVGMSMVLEVAGGKLLDIDWKGEMVLRDAHTGGVEWVGRSPGVTWRIDAMSDEAGRYVVNERMGAPWIFDVAARRVWQLDRPPEALYSRLALSDQGRWIFGIEQTRAGSGRAVVMFDRESRRLVKRWPMPTVVNSVVATERGNLMAVGQANGRLTVMDFETTRVLFAGQIADGDLWRLELSPDGRTLIAPARDGLAGIFAVSPSGVRQLGQVSGFVDYRFDATGQRLLCSFNRAAVRTLAEVLDRRYQLPEGASPEYLLLSDGKSVVARVKSGGIARFDLGQRRPAAEAIKIPGTLSDRGFARHATAAGVKLLDGRGGIVDVGTGRVLARMSTSDDVHGAWATPGGRLFVVERPAHDLAVYDVALETFVRDLGLRDTSIVGVSPDGRVLIGTDGTGVLSLIDSTTWAVRTVTDYAPYSARGFQFSRDGRRVLAAFDSGLVRMLEFPSMRQIRVFAQHPSSAMWATFSPDETRVVSTGSEGSVRVWDAATGRLLTILTGHRAACLLAAFVDQGRTIASLDADGVLIRWEAGPRSSDP